MFYKISVTFFCLKKFIVIMRFKLMVTSWKVRCIISQWQIHNFLCPNVSAMKSRCSKVDSIVFNSKHTQSVLVLALPSAISTLWWIIQEIQARPRHLVSNSIKWRNGQTDTTNQIWCILAWKFDIWFLLITNWSNFLYHKISTISRTRRSAGPNYVSKTR